MKRKKKIVSVIILLLLAVTGGLQLFDGGYPVIEDVKVVRVVDGDTFVAKIDGMEERVRMIGIDCPESVHPDERKNTEAGQTASEFTEEALTDQTVDLELDVEERDQYGRILAYVYLDGEMYNETLLNEGYAKAVTYPPNVRYTEEFRKLEATARSNEKGLWGEY